jgi:hypothetical protein
MTPDTTFPGASDQTNGRLRNFTPWFSRLVMSLPLIIFTLISFRYLTNPGHAVPGVVLTSPEAFTDTRVTGAWMLTLLAMLITSLSSRSRLWLGHLQLAIFMALTLAIRIFGFIHDGTTLAMGNQRVITVVEIVFLALNVAGLAMQAIAARRTS